MVHVVRSANDDAGGLFIAAVDEVMLSDNTESKRVVFDCEGVDLSRIGSVELISICFLSKEIFLVDVGKKGGEPDREIVKAVKDLFEDPTVTKIIHDCRMDSDTLFHHYCIDLQNVHDTSCFHHIITDNENKSLNDVLAFNGIKPNITRDKSIYRSQPRFWETRPLTNKMITWASSDVDRLFDVTEKQLDGISDNAKGIAIARSNANIKHARDMKVVNDLSVRRPGLFIGRGGTNLRNLQRHTNTLVYQHSGGLWFAYYSSIDGLNKVKSAMQK
jgi:exonuclease 3'-5' domain-containing protein 1